MSEPVLLTMWSLYPKIQPLVLLLPHVASVSIPGYGTEPFSLLFLCQTRPLLALSRVLSTETMYGSMSFSSTNSLPIESILGLTSREMVLNLLSSVLLSGSLRNPQALAILALYGLSIERNEWRALLLGILSHNLTTKHLSITVGE